MTHNIPRKSQIIFTLLLVGLLGLTLSLYTAGLPGRFMLDDETNLYRLNLLNNNPSLDSLITYVADGLSSALGRPLSLISFAAQFYSWPNDPGAFKYINIMIHLLNGMLILILSRQLLRFMRIDGTHSLFYALAISALWLLHPIQISTVLYVVQRMTQLSCFFMLLGLICYFRGRQQQIDNPSRVSIPLLWMSMGIGAGGILAILSKENGILLPFYVLVVEFTLLQNSPVQNDSRPRLWRYWRNLFLYFPVLLLLLYLAYSFNTFIANYHHREFNMLERVLTETRVLSHYIFKIFVIQPSSYGLFQDDFSLSKSIINPITTLSSILFMLGLITLGFVYRQRQPILAFVIFWFFVSHILESGFIPLEIYFEHRNYLALFSLALGMVIFSVWLFRRIKSSLIISVTVIAACGWVLIMLVVTAQEISLWGKPLLQAQIWGKERPWSKRAQVTRVNVYALYGQYKKASTSLHELFKKFPHNAEIYFSLFQLQCLDQRITLYDFNGILKRLEKSKTSYAAITTLAKIMLLKEQKKCAGLKNSQLEQLLSVLIVNKRFSSQLADLYFLKARFYLLDKSLAKALHFLDLSWKKQPRMMVKMYQIQVYAYQKQYKSSYQHILTAKKYLKSHFKERFLFQEELGKWEKLILAALNQGSTK